MDSHPAATDAFAGTSADSPDAPIPSTEHPVIAPTIVVAAPEACALLAAHAEPDAPGGRDLTVSPAPIAATLAGCALIAPPVVSACRPVPGRSMSRFRPTQSANSADCGWRQRPTRTPHRLPCRVRLVDTRTGEVRTVAGQTVNLSPGGVALEVCLEVPVGTWVETLVPRADGTPLFLCGTVVNVRRTLAAGYELGVELAREDG